MPDFPAISITTEGLVLPAISVVVDWTPVPTITVDWTGIPELTVDWTGAPMISINWAGAPTLSCVVTVACPSSPSMMALSQPMDDSFADSFENTDMLNIETGDIGIPSEIKVLVPEFPELKIIHDLPVSIDLKVPIIPDINIIGPVEPLPSIIEIVTDVHIPEFIRIVSDGLPDVISLDASSVPKAIYLELVNNIPSTIFIDASGIPDQIQVVGIPESIELKGFIPSEIMIKAPDNLEIPLVYKGAPIPIQFDMKAFTSENGEDLPCFAIVPCGSKK